MVSKGHSLVRFPCTWKDISYAWYQWPMILLHETQPFVLPWLLTRNLKQVPQFPGTYWANLPKFPLTLTSWLLNGSWSCITNRHVENFCIKLTTCFYHCFKISLEQNVRAGKTYLRTLTRVFPFWIFITCKYKSDHIGEGQVSWYIF